MKKTFYYHYERGLFWFRIFGYGLLFENFTKRKTVLFSDRNKLNKNAWYFGNYKIQILKRKELGVYGFTS